MGEADGTRRETAPLGTPRHRLDQALHDVTNAVSAARAYAEVLRHRAASEAAVVDAMLAQLDRIGETIRAVRRGAYDEYAPGDILECMRCGHTFVHRKRPGASASCRRCRGVEVTRWRPG